MTDAADRSGVESGLRAAGFGLSALSMERVNKMVRLKNRALDRRGDLLQRALPVLDDHPRSYFRRLALEIREELGMDDA